MQGNRRAVVVIVVFWIVVPVLWLVFLGPNLLHWVSQWLGGR